MSLYIHDGKRLCHHESLYYVKTSLMMCRASEYDMVRTLYLKFKTDLDDDGHTILDFARFIPQLVTPEDMNIQPWLDEGVAEIQHKLRSEVIIHLINPSGITEVKIMSKREAREFGYVKENEFCPNELRISVNA